MKFKVSEYPISKKEVGAPLQRPIPTSGGQPQYPIMKEREDKSQYRLFDLQERFIDFSVRIIKSIEILPETKAAKHIASQLLRSGTSPAPNYGEAQSAESKADFIHKLKIALKELRETEVWLRVIVKALLIPQQKVASLLQETDELIAILVKSIQTAQKRKEGYNIWILNIPCSVLDIQNIF